MASGQTFLVDTSVLHRARQPGVRERLELLMDADLLASCEIVNLEVLYSSRDLRTYEAVSAELSGLLDASITPATLERARAVQHGLARTGRHRLPIPDLIIAAAAELAGHTVLHYDSDFELIAEVTGQPQQRVVPRGSI